MQASPRIGFDQSGQLALLPLSALPCRRRLAWERHKRTSRQLSETGRCPYPQIGLSRPGLPHIAIFGNIAKHIVSLFV